MERPRHCDLRRLLDFVAEAVTAALSDRAQATDLTLDGMARLVPCDVAIITAWDERSQQLTTTASESSLAAFRRREPELWVACLPQHPTVAHYERTRRGAAVRFSDLLSRRAYHGLPLYQYFFRDYEIEYKLDARIYPTPGHVDLGCCRATRDFTERERATLDALRPYLTAIFRNADAGVLAKELRSTFGLTRREGEVLALAARGMSNREIAGTLFIATGTVRKHLEHIFAKLGVRTRTLAVAHVARAVASSTAGDWHSELLANIGPAEIAATYGLTDREREVLAHASAGESNATIAAELHVSPETVKKHLDHVHAKLGVTRRGQATGRALSLGLL